MPKRSVFSHKKLFQSKLGSTNKVSEVTNLKRETADILSNYIVESLKEHKLLDKIITFPGDNKINYNTNFRGVL